MKLAAATETGTHRDHCAICDRLTDIPDTDDLCSGCRADVKMRCREQAEWVKQWRKRKELVA